MNTSGRIIVAGHLCLDIVPEMRGVTGSNSKQMFQGGQLTQIGPVTLLPGGVVANTGQALRILGFDALLMGKVGDDRFGNLVGELLDPPRDEVDLPGAPALIVDPAVSTSYTLVLTPPDIDRVYFHCPGANDSFSAADIDYDAVADASIFHFGYPPLMARMFEGNGEELARIFRLARQKNVVTSLDMAMPDPGASAGRAPWRKILENTLPFVDVFLPSVEETVRMLRPEWATNLHGGAVSATGDTAPSGPRFAGFSLDHLSELSAELLQMGCRVVVLKLGSDGLYVRTGFASGVSANQSLPPVLAVGAAEFGARELISSCYSANVVSAVGAGDATVAGFLGALSRELSLAECVNMALGVGAKSVEDLHSTGGIPSWEVIRGHMETGWPKHSLDLEAGGWQLIDTTGVWERV